MARPGREEAAEALRRVAFLLERGSASRYRVAAFRKAAAAVESVAPDRLDALHRAGRLAELPGVGNRTGGVIGEVLAGRQVPYLEDLERSADVPPGPGAALRRELRGDLHSHTEASDGTTSMQEMVLAALELGHEYLAVTDHSPRLTVANGLSPERLQSQIGKVRALSEAVAPFRLLAGIEVDILDDGSLDQEPELLGSLDVVVASVHSKLRMDRAAMTQRMLAAVRNPHLDVLGHCTGRYISGRTRPQSEFDARAVFAACAEHGVAVEINCQPRRQDPPDDLLRLAVECGCLFSIDSDGHAPGELAWLSDGCDRAVVCGVPPERVVNRMAADELLEWTARRRGPNGRPVG